ncbi:hypothetical protein IAT38_004973 [Cryptococcus sp. DSM 104549]
MSPPGGYKSPSPTRRASSRQRRQPQPEAREDDWESSSDSAPPSPQPRTPQRLPKPTPGRASPSISASSSARQSAPRRREPVRRRPAIPSVSSPRPSQARPPTPGKLPPAPRPPLADTLRLLLTPFQLVLIPLETIFSPFIAHAVNAVLLALFALGAIYFVLPRIPNLLLWALGKTAGWILGDIGDRIVGLGEGLGPVGQVILAFPVRTLSTPACALTGLGCQLSFLSSLHATSQDGGTMAKPFWEWFGEEEKGNDVDVGQVARALTKEVRRARDIFDSVRMLGDESAVGTLEHVRMWELGVTVMTGSNLEDKEYFGKQLVELGNLARDLTDEVVHIDSVSVNAFSWLQWEFSRLVQLLSQPPSTRPSSEALAAKLHTLLLRLSSTLDTLHDLTGTSVLHASRASTLGQDLSLHLHTTHSSLLAEHNRAPPWRKYVDKSAHLVRGGEPSKNELIARDLELTGATIKNLGSLQRQLEGTRQLVKSFRDQIGMFDASMMGFHLGASEEMGLGPEEEVRILAGVVGELGRAVGRAKGRWVEDDVLEIEG